MKISGLAMHPKGKKKAEALSRGLPARKAASTSPSSAAAADGVEPWQFARAGGAAHE